MSDERKKPGMAFWATVVVVMLVVGYPLSFGPACWLVRHRLLARPTAAHIYRPILWHSHRLPDWAFRAVRWYGGDGEEIGTFVNLRSVLYREALEGK